MVLSKRERYVGIGTGLVLGVVLLLHLVIFPLIDSRKKLTDDIESAKSQLARANETVKLSDKARQNWTSTSGGHIRKDESESQSQLSNSIRDWAAAAQMSLSSVKPERAPEKEKDFYKLTMRVTANGQMGQIGQFLYRVHTGSIPVRVTDLSISSRKEGFDDLTLSVAIATIYPAPDSNKPGGAAASAGWEAQR